MFLSTVTHCRYFKAIFSGLSVTQMWNLTKRILKSAILHFAFSHGTFPTYQRLIDAAAEVHDSKHSFA